MVSPKVPPTTVHKNAMEESWNPGMTIEKEKVEEGGKERGNSNFALSTALAHTKELSIRPLLNESSNLPLLCRPFPYKTAQTSTRRVCGSFPIICRESLKGLYVALGPA